MTSSAERVLHIDIETYSSADIKTSGAFHYAEASDFQVLLLAYAWDDGPVTVLDLTDPFDENELSAVYRCLDNPVCIKAAHNAAFERACLGRHLGRYLDPGEWHDTMFLAAQNGLPQSLEDAGAALGISRQKLKTGTQLINYFCKPCKATNKNGGRTRNLPEHAPEKWELFKEYCRRDVEAEQAIYYRLKDALPMPEWEQRVQALDAEINERGVLIDRELAEAAVAMDEDCRADNLAEMARLTGLSNPNSVAQLKTWLEGCGLSPDSLDKATVEEMLAEVKDPTTRRVLELRRLLGKTSTKKYQAMLDGACKDGRVRGIMRYYGAGRTGRWAGRMVQPQNLPQNHLDNIAAVRKLVRQRDRGTLELCYDSVPDVLSQLIRTALTAKQGYTFLVADYSAIEARVIAYLAGEKWRMDAFAAGEDIYCTSASKMFGVPVEKHGVNGHLRQKGKIAELACGYGGGVKALRAFGADKMGLSKEEMAAIVANWRAASPAITRLWRDVETAAKRALRTPGKRVRVSETCNALFWRNGDAMLCMLPSGRTLSYWGADIDDDGYIYYWGLDQQTRRWTTMETWGGRLVENIVQAFARDCLAAALLRLKDAGYAVVFHVHDEIIAEAPEGLAAWEDMAGLMAEPLDWAPGLMLTADGYETRFYMKD